jgi:hypothetical protein
MRQHFFGALPFMLFFSLAALILFPPFFYVTFRLSSMTVGLVLAMMVLVLFFHQTSPIIRAGNLSRLAVLLIFLLTAHSIYFVLTDYDDRQIPATFLFFIMLTIAGVFSNVIYKCNGLVLLRSFEFLTIIGLLIGFGSFVIDTNFLNYEYRPKPIFPFSEPSHYALGFSSVFFVTGVFLGKVQRITLLILIVLLGVMIPSVVLLVVAFVMVVVFYVLPLKTGNIVLIAILAVVGVQALSLVDMSKLSYFYERIPFAENVENPVIRGSANMSALVYMQGWEVLSDSMVNTTGLGVGLYNMEKTIPGHYGEIIYDRVGHYQNRAEGSFFGSKLITEFGIFGVLVLAAYFIFLLRSLRFFYRLGRYVDNQHRSIEKIYPVSLVYAHSVIVVFVVEAFVRGAGYFTTGVFLLLVAMFLTQRFRMRFRQNRTRQSAVPVEEL